MELICRCAIGVGSRDRPYDVRSSDRSYSVLAWLTKFHTCLDQLAKRCQVFQAVSASQQIALGLLACQTPRQRQQEISIVRLQIAHRPAHAAEGLIVSKIVCWIVFGWLT